MSQALYLVSLPYLFLFLANTHLFTVGIALGGLSTSLQVSIWWSWASSALITSSHSGHSSDHLTSFKLAAPSFTATEKVSLLISVTMFMFSSSLSEKGSF